MEKKLFYWGNTGNDIENPSEEFLKEIILGFDADYWSMKEGTGDSGLKFEHMDNPLIFFYDEPFGFFIYYNMEFVPLLKGIQLNDEIVIEHYIGGEPMRIPSICYRTRQESLEIIIEFVRNQKMLEKYNWVRLGEIDYLRIA